MPFFSSAVKLSKHVILVVSEMFVSEAEFSKILRILSFEDAPRASYASGRKNECGSAILVMVLVEHAGVRTLRVG